MTTKKRAKPEHLQKLTALFEQYPDGLNMRQIQTELQTSPHNAQAALDELGAVKAGAKWVLPDEVAPGAKADTAAIEPLQDLHELPTTEKIQLVGNPDQLPVSIVDASDVNARKEFYERAATRLGFEIKRIDQSVFDGLPSEIMWAAVDSHGTCLGFRKPPIISAGCYKQNVRVGDVENPIFIGWSFDNTNWMDSIIQRESFIDQLGIENFQKECERTSTENPVSEQKQDDATCSNCIDQPYVYQNPIANQFYQESKSDYAKVLDVMLTKVLNAVKDNGGATIGRICELVDVYPDDVPDCVDILVDNGQLISRPLYFTTVYEVAA